MGPLLATGGPLLAGGLLAAAGLALVWAASRRRTVRVAVHELPARPGRRAVRVRVRYELVPERGHGERRDLRDLLGRLTRAAGEARPRELEALVREAQEEWGVVVRGIERDPA